jgi:iron donor protein CyaY
MEDTQYHTLADATLTHCHDRLEPGFDAGSIDDLEFKPGILTIRCRSGRVYVLSKHAPTQQLWYASPRQGGLHFRYDAAGEKWHLPDGRNMAETLAADMSHEGIEVAL